MGIFSKLRRDEDGATIVEMGLMAPILAAMLVGAVDMALGFSEKLEVEQAAQRAVEQVMQGRSSGGDYTDIVPEAAAAAGVPESQVVVTYWLECDGVAQGEDVTSCGDDDDGNPVPYARYVNVRITKTYEPFLGSELAGANADGNYTLVGEAGMRVQ